MYAEFYKFLELLDSEEEGKITYRRRDRPLIVGVLLYLVIHVDGKVRDAETDFFKKVAIEKLGVAREEFFRFENNVKRLVKAPDKVEILINELRATSDGEKAEVMEFLHDMSISDLEFHELEFNFVAKIRNLIEA